MNIRPSLWRVTVGGCLAMVYVTCVTSPVTAAFVRDLGGGELHFGLLEGVSLAMLALQFVGAWLMEFLPRRKPLFMVMLIACRLLYLPLAFLPLFVPAVPPIRWVWLMILLVGASVGMNQLVTPLWLSWMGDLIPRRLLNRYWGARQFYMTLTWTLSYLAVAAFSYFGAGLSPRIMFPILVVCGVTAGVVDILLFGRVHEPSNPHQAGQGFWRMLAAPLRAREYRSLVRFNSLFGLSAMFAAAFMQVYALKELRLPVWKTNLIWSLVGLGSVFVSRLWGRLADRFGHRPVLVICAAFKPVVCLAFLFATPANALWLLGGVFFFDSMVNSGQQIATNGYMISMAPREARSMFIAAMTAFGGLAGGLGAILGGVFLRHTETLVVTFAGRDWTHYHLLFAISFGMRILCVPLAAAIREPSSRPPAEVIAHLAGQWPLRMLVFPVGLYRRWRGRPNGDEHV